MGGSEIHFGVKQKIDYDKLRFFNFLSYSKYASHLSSCCIVAVSQHDIVDLLLKQRISRKLVLWGVFLNVLNYIVVKHFVFVPISCRSILFGATNEQELLFLFTLAHYVSKLLQMFSAVQLCHSLFGTFSLVKTNIIVLRSSY